MEAQKHLSQLPFYLKTQPKLCFTTNNGYIFLKASEILYIKSYDIYTYIYHGDSRCFSTQSLKQIIEILPPDQFVRCHRSYVVNSSKIIRLKKAADFKLIMENGSEIPLARRRKRDILEKIAINPMAAYRYQPV